MKLHHQTSGSPLEGQATSSSFEHEIKRSLHLHKAKGAFNSVPGTRSDDVANNSAIAVYWILKDMPL